MEPHWIMVMGAAALVAVYVGSSLYYYFAYHRKTEDTPPDSPRLGRAPRPKKGTGFNFLASQVVLVGFLFVTHELNLWTLADVGFKNEAPHWFSFLAGITLYFVFVKAYEFRLRMQGTLDLVKDVNFEAMRSIWPRYRWEKPLACIGACVGNPFTEEILYRGFLIYMLGNLLDAHLFTILLGWALNMATHLYQGWRVMVSHTMVHISVVMLLYSPFGLLGAIGFHFAADTFPVATFRSQMLEWRDRRRAEDRVRREARGVLS